MTYAKCRGGKSRGDRYAAWGCSWWYFEFGPDGTITRQVEVYDGGVRLRYGPDHLEDTFGRLGEGRRQDMDMLGAEELTADQFEAVWASANLNVTDFQVRG